MYNLVIDLFWFMLFKFMLYLSLSYTSSNEYEIFNIVQAHNN